MSNTDFEHAERIAVLESKVDGIHDTLKELKGLLEPMIALYKAGRFVLGVGAAIAGFTHWDYIMVWIDTLIHPPKH